MLSRPERQLGGTPHPNATRRAGETHFFTSDYRVCVCPAILVSIVFLLGVSGTGSGILSDAARNARNAKIPGHLPVGIASPRQGILSYFPFVDIITHQLRGSSFCCLRTS
jgi:hypothetical protein